MLTIFATPRAFAGELDVIQRNAVASWTRMRPRPQVLLMGNARGTAAVCRQLGVEHVTGVRLTEFGTPFADSMVDLAEQRASHSLLVWVAADTILLDDVMEAAATVARRFQRFCMIAGRYHLANPAPIDFDDARWHARLRAAAFGPLLEDISAGDFFLFPKHFWGAFPPFVEGRSTLDGWMFFRTLETGGALVDATDTVMTIHQDHGYGHHPGGADGVRFGPEARYNRTLAGKRILTRDNANWILTSHGLHSPPWSFRRHIAQCGRFAASHPWAGWPSRIYRHAAERLVLRPVAARADAIARAKGASLDGYVS